MEIKDMIKKLEGLYVSHGRYEVLDDWFAVMALAIVQACSEHNESWQKREASYLDIVKHYSSEELNVFKDCFSMLVSIMNEDAKKGCFKDWLGEIYMESCTASKQSGQCFTPYSVGKLLASISLNEQGIAHGYSKLVTLNDPCVGSGCLPIAYCEELYRLGINYQKQLYVEANDVDERCFHMTYIQLSLLGVRAKVQWKNTLSQEMYDEWMTPFLVLNTFNTKQFFYTNEESRKELQ